MLKLKHIVIILISDGSVSYDVRTMSLTGILDYRGVNNCIHNSLFLKTKGDFINYR